MKRVLWVEDQAIVDLMDLFAEAVHAGYSVTVCPDATSALDAMQKETFDFVVVDVRILPGNSSEWYSYYQQSGLDKKPTRLGIELLRSIWNVRPAVPIAAMKRPAWLKPDMVGILTVETYEGPDSLKSDLDELGIPRNHYASKTEPGDPSPRLRELLVVLDRGMADSRCDVRE